MRHRLAGVALVALCALLLAMPAAHAGDGQGTAMDPKMDPDTGEPPGAPVGCCCIPKITAGELACVGDTTEFDCKAQCAEIKDGRLPSGCTWTAGACPK